MMNKQTGLFNPACLSIVRKKFGGPPAPGKWLPKKTTDPESQLFVSPFG
jgi:hypothetical protein